MPRPHRDRPAHRGRGAWAARGLSVAAGGSSLSSVRAGYRHGVPESQCDVLVVGAGVTAHHRCQPCRGRGAGGHPRSVPTGWDHLLGGRRAVRTTTRVPGSPRRGMTRVHQPPPTTTGHTLLDAALAFPRPGTAPGQERALRPPGNVPAPPASRLPGPAGRIGRW